MPLLKKPPSLRKAALTNIARHLFWLGLGIRDRDVIRSMMEDGTYATIVGPFIDWPSVLLEDLLDTFAEQRSISRIAYHLLLQPQLQKLSLANGVGDVNHALEIIEARCHALTSLNLSYLENHLSENHLYHLLPKFPSLISLNLRMTLTTDQVLGQISSHCPLLRELDLSATPVTDEGLRMLALSASSSMQMRNLQRFNLLETRATPQGIIQVLHNLPNLKELEYEYLFQAFEVLNLLESSVSHPDIVNYGLQTLKTCIEVDCDLSLQTAVERCPNLRSVALVAGFLSNASLLIFSELAHLTELSITNSSNLSLDFDEAILPLLQICGPRLQNLILNRFTSADLTAIGIACPRLVKLALAEICHFQPMEIFCANLFQHLEVLEFWAVPGVNVPSLMFKQLLHACQNIRKIFLKNCHVITDAWFQEIFQVNPMSQLTHLTLDDCPYISVSTLATILESSNDLHVLRIWYCTKIQAPEYEFLRTKIQTGNMDVDFAWCPPDSS